MQNINVDLRFLLAELRMNFLLSNSLPGNIEDALNYLPRGTNALDVMYELTMTRINNQTEGSRALVSED